MSDGQVLFAEGLTVDLLELWDKMARAGVAKWNHYALWSEATVHKMLHTARCTVEIKGTFAEYSKVELQRCIIHLKRLKMQYGKSWKGHWEPLVAARKAAEVEEKQVVEECYTWARARGWMDEQGLSGRVEERFEFVKLVGTEKYYRLRPERVTLYDYKEASQLERMAGGRGFDELFELAQDVGNAMLYRAKFTMEAAR